MHEYRQPRRRRSSEPEEETGLQRLKSWGENNKVKATVAWFGFCLLCIGGTVLYLFFTSGHASANLDRVGSGLEFTYEAVVDGFLVQAMVLIFSIGGFLLARAIGLGLVFLITAAVAGLFVLAAVDFIPELIEAAAS